MILITGSSGQIGTNLGLKLLDEGYQVLGVDLRKNPWSARIPTLLIDLSIRKEILFEKLQKLGLCTNIELVVHLAAYPKVFEITKNPDLGLKDYVINFNVVELCKTYHIPILFSSSREVYSTGKKRRTMESEANFVVDSPYSAVKISMESLIHSYANCFGLKFLIFRLSNVYGRYDNDLKRMERVIPLFIHRIKNGFPVTIYGKDKVLDFTYIDDCISGLTGGITRLLEGRVENETFNLAFGEGNSLLKLVKCIGDHLQKIPIAELADSRAGEITHYVADIRKARELIDYQPATPLEDGIRKSIIWSQQYYAKTASMRNFHHIKNNTL